MRSGLNGVWQKRMPVASASALPMAAAIGLYGLSLIDLAPKGPVESDVSAKQYLGSRNVAKLRQVIVAECRIDRPARHRRSPFPRRAWHPSDWATPPSTWPRHCIGLMTRPASAACTLRRTLIAPVFLFTATRNAWTLKATERGVPVAVPSATRRRPCARAAAASSVSGKSLPGRVTAPSISDHAGRSPPAYSAAKSRIFPRRASQASCVARPATIVPVLP